MPRRGARLSFVALITATALALAGGLAATAPATGDPGERASGEPTMLGLPPLSEAQQYVLAPSSRTVRPVRVQQASQVNHDFVTAASQTSEVSAHDLRAGTSSVARVGGYPVRRAGAGVDGGHFSYTLRVPRNQSFELRVEEAGSANATYDVLVNGQRVHTRNLDLYAAQGRPIGLTHYSVTVPAQLVTTDRAEVSFVNGEVPGDGAQIHAVWANAPHGARNPKDLNLPAYGGIVRRPDDAMGKGAPAWPRTSSAVPTPSTTSAVRSAARSSSTSTASRATRGSGWPSASPTPSSPRPPTTARTLQASPPRPTSSRSPRRAP